MLFLFFQALTLLKSLPAAVLLQSADSSLQPILQIVCQVTEDRRQLRV